MQKLKANIIYYVVKNCDKNWRLYNAQLDFYDLTFVHDGQAHYTVNGIEYKVKKGNAIFIPKGAKRIANTGFMRCTAFNFNFSESIKTDIPPMFRWNDNMAISYYLKEYHSAKLNKTEIDILKSNKLFELILLEVMQKNKQKHLNPHVEKIKKYIQESVDKNITLEEISKVANLHPVYCGELFKKHEKCSIMSYHENLRMQHAALLLESGEFNVGQTALQLGYEDAAYFSRIFKKNIGVSPSIYQAQVI